MTASATIVAIVLTALLFWASFSDVRVRRVPNACILAIIGLFVLQTIALHPGPALSGLYAALLSLAICYGLYAFSIVGAGDAKLFASVALLIGLADLGSFALATVFAGGVMALISLASRPRRALAMLQLRGKGDFGRGIPYGVAITVGALVVVWQPFYRSPTPPQVMVSSLLG